MNNLLYIHGFNSSSLSYKAQQLKAWLANTHPTVNFICPDLPDQPHRAIAVLEQQLSSSPDCALIGSSLGGFYALYLAEKYQLPAVMVNPAIKPWLLLQNYLGQQHNYHRDHHWLLDRQTVEQLKAYDVAEPSAPHLLRLYLQTGDETLDYQVAANRYPSIMQIIEIGGDHSFTHFERHFDDIAKFFNIGNSPIAK